METIFNFDYFVINAKNGVTYVKMLLLTTDDNEKISAYTSFAKYEGALIGMITTPDFKDSLEIISSMYVGKYGNDSRYVTNLGYTDVDGKPQACNIIFTKNY